MRDLLEERFRALLEEGDAGAEQRVFALEQEGQERIALLGDVVQCDEGGIHEDGPCPVGKLAPSAPVDHLGRKATIEAAVGQVAQRLGPPLVEPDAPACAEPGEALGEAGMVGDERFGAGGLEVRQADAGDPQEPAGAGQDDLPLLTERQQPGQPVGEVLIAPPAEPERHQGLITRGMRKLRASSSQAKGS